MRTIASTVMTPAEAEAAGRRLKAMGVAPDLIQVRSVADGGSDTGVVVSAKVSPEQVGAANAILKERAGAAVAAPEPRRAPEPAAAPAAVSPPPVQEREAVHASSQTGDARRPVRSGSRINDMGWSQIFVILAVLAIVGMVLGAMLGKAIF